MSLFPVETSCGRTIQPDLSPSTRLVVLASVTDDFVNVFPRCVLPRELSVFHPILKSFPFVRFTTDLSQSLLKLRGSSCSRWGMGL